MENAGAAVSDPRTRVCGFAQQIRERSRKSPSPPLLLFGPL